MTTPTTTYPETADLVALQQQFEQLPSVSQAVDDINQELAYLQQAGADSRSVQGITDGANSLLENIDGLNTLLHTAVDLAKRARAQREEIRRAFEGLRSDLQAMNLENGEIDDFYQRVSDDILDGERDYVSDFFYDLITDQIQYNTPLTYEEVSKLVRLLTGETDFELDDDMWGTFRAWLEDASREAFEYIEED